MRDYVLTYRRAYIDEPIAIVYIPDCELTWRDIYYELYLN